MSVPSGWYDDPEDPTQMRYWDGVLWTTNRAPKVSPSAAQSQIGYASPVPAAADASAPGAQPTHPGQPPVGPGPAQHPGQPPAQYPYGQQGYGQQAPGQYPPGQQAPGQYPPGQYPPGQYPPAQYPPGAYPQAGGPAPGTYGAPWVLSGPTTPDGVPLASWWARFLAYVIDFVLVALLVVPLAWSAYSSVFSSFDTLFAEAFRAAEAGNELSAADQEAFTQELVGPLLLISFVSLLVNLAYQTFFLVRFGATLGKKALGLKVRLRERPGNLSVGTALLRQALPAGLSLGSNVPGVGFLTSIASLLNYLWPLWDGNRQALHDKVAKTNVVKSRY